MLNPNIYTQLSIEQQKAVMHGEGPILVTAGPGSGKTHVLTSRILYLIQERQIPPGKILVITFTKEAARSMQSRFFDLIQKFPIPMNTHSGQVSFGTFHSFFYQILRCSEKYTHYRIIGEKEKQKLIYPLLKKIAQKRKENKDNYYESVTMEDINRILSAISYEKNTGRNPEALKLLKEPWKQQYDRISREYEKGKEERRQMDLDDLLTFTTRMLQEDKGLLQYWQNCYSYVLIDEFQDCNALQFELVKQIFTDRGNVFAVGDDDQAIYGFRGAEPGIMQRFLEEYKYPETVILGKNYRCAPKVVEASAKVIAGNRLRVNKILESGRRDCEGSVRLIGFHKGSEEREYVIERCMGKSTPELDQWAVLFRTNALIGTFTAELLQAGIPFVVKEKLQSIYEHFIVRDIMDYFRAANGCRERQLFLRIWNRPRLSIGREALDQPQVDFQRIRKFYSSEVYGYPEAVRDLEQFERKLKQLYRFPPELGVNFIRRGFGYEDYLRIRAGGNKELLESWLEILDWLTEEGKKYVDFAQWEIYQKQATDQLKQENSRNQPRKEGIHVMTMHAAKGLEYDSVFLMDVNEGTIPKQKRGEPMSEKLLEEERRLLYVGMTRAKNHLELLFRTGTKNRPMLPSGFLEPIWGDADIKV